MSGTGKVYLIIWPVSVYVQLTYINEGLNAVVVRRFFCH